MNNKKLDLRVYLEPDEHVYFRVSDDEETKIFDLTKMLGRDLALHILKKGAAGYWEIKKFYEDIAPQLNLDKEG